MQMKQRSLKTLSLILSMTQNTKTVARGPVTPASKAPQKAPTAKAAPAKQAAPAEDDFFSAENSTKVSWFKPENIGDSVKGVFVDRFITESSLTPGQFQENYLLVTDSGDKVQVSGRGRRKSDGIKVIFGMEKIPLGAIIGFIYTDDKDTGKQLPAKIVEIRYRGETDDAVLAKYQKSFVTGTGSAAARHESAPASATAEEEGTDSESDPALPSFDKDGE